MSKKQTMYEEPLPEDLAMSLLRGSAPEIEGSVWDNLQQARRHLADARTLAQDYLSHSPLSSLAAKEAAQRSNRKGDSSLYVGEDGTILLRVRAKGNPFTDDRQWHSTLPALKDLRQTAEELGIDPQKFGRAKKDLLAAIETARKEEKTPRRKMIKTAPALSIRKDVPMGNEPDSPNGIGDRIAKGGYGIDNLNSILCDPRNSKPKSR